MRVFYLLYIFLLGVAYIPISPIAGASERASVEIYDTQDILA